MLKEDPFENRPTDISMNQMANNIERSIMEREIKELERDREKHELEIIKNTNSIENYSPLKKPQ